MAAPVGTEQTADISVAISGLIWPLAPVGDKLEPESRHLADEAATPPRGTQGACGASVGNESNLLLAIRTIAVSARAAVTSNKKLGRPDLAAKSARRGLMLLEGLREQLAAAVHSEAHQRFDAAVRELTTAAAGEDAVVDERKRAGGRRKRKPG